ncbi:hypothetical protein J2TS4_50700 [Paenibacillus sp. J2TS4]|nr:hypothetical protein J2TS4_50700 [Paenibacillus sp. J2TS4]
MTESACPSRAFYSGMKFLLNLSEFYLELIIQCVVYLYLYLLTRYCKTLEIESTNGLGDFLKNLYKIEIGGDGDGGSLQKSERARFGQLVPSYPKLCGEGNHAPPVQRNA